MPLLRLAAAALAITTLAAVSPAGPASAASGKLVIYTSQLEKDAQQTVDAFKAKHPDVEVEWTRNGTSKLMNILRAEIAAGQIKPDVLLIADVINMGQLKKEGRLMAYKDAAVDAYDAALYDADMTYFGSKLITTGIIYNTAAPMQPSSWKDLLAADAKGLVAMPSPLYSGAALNHMHSLVNAPDLGWDFYEGLAGNGITPKGGNGGTFKAVASGEKLYGIVIDFLAIRNKLEGSPVEFVFPEEGVSAVTEPVAILATAKNVPASQAFVDFVLSEEGQKLAAAQGFLPAHPAVAPPPGFPEQADIKLMSFDAEQAISDDKAARLKFTELFGE